MKLLNYLTLYALLSKKFQIDLKKRHLPRNVDIYVDMDKKRVFQNDLKKSRYRRYVDILIYDIWAKKPFLKKPNFSPKY